jgi:hypothetical protein
MWSCLVRVVTAPRRVRIRLEIICAIAQVGLCIGSVDVEDGIEEDVVAESEGYLGWQASGVHWSARRKAGVLHAST